MLAVVVGLCCLESAQSQRMGESRLVATYLYNLAKSISWPNERELASFKVAVYRLRDEGLWHELRLMSRAQKLKNVPIVVSRVDKIEELSQYHLVYVDPEQNNAIETIYGEIDGRPVLMITSGFAEKQLVMVNLFKTNDRRLLFEVNKANIINQGLTPLPDLILYGGTEIDVARLYKEGQASLFAMQKQLRAREQKLMSLSEQIAKQEKEKKGLLEQMVTLEDSIRASDETIGKQKSIIANQTSEIEAGKAERTRLRADVESLNAELTEQEKELALRRQQIQVGRQERDELRAEVERRSQELVDQRKELAARGQRLDAISQDIEQREARLVELNLTIRQQESEIAQQRESIAELGGIVTAQESSLRYLRIAFALAVLLVLTIVVGYLSKRRDNKRLEEHGAELALAKESAEAARAHAEEANQAKSVFLSNVSHELRTPLNAILGYAQILRRRPLESDVLGALHTVQQSGEHLLTLIEDILDISKIEAGKLAIAPTTVHLPAFLEGVASIVRSRAARKNIDFSVEKPTALPEWILADETRLRQILLNLLGNAVKFTTEGRVVLRVHCVCSAEEGNQGSEAGVRNNQRRFRFEIQDTGIGIPPEQQESIFQPFEQVADLTALTEGTGLGLAISRELVRLMGGELHVESQPGQGSLFFFETVFPLAKAERKEASVPALAVVGYRGARRRILVVDDMASNRGVLRDMLVPLGFEVGLATNGREALETAKKDAPDVVLMDRWTPEMNGVEALRAMRGIPELKDCPVLAVSASVSESDQNEMLAAGFDAFLPKPVSWPRLALLLQEHLDLEWEYGEPEQPESEGVGGEKSVVPPPAADLAGFLELAMQGNMRAIAERARRLEEQDERLRPFAGRLRKLAEAFETKTVLELIASHMEGDHERE